MAGEQHDVTTTGTRAESHGGEDGGGGCGIHLVDASADTFSGYLHGFISLIPFGYLCGTFVDTSGDALPTSFPEPALSYVGVPSRLWIVHKEADSKQKRVERAASARNEESTGLRGDATIIGLLARILE